MTEQISPIRRDLDVENGVAREQIGDWRADFRFRRQDQKACRVGAEAELDGAAKHSFTLDAAKFTFSNLGAVWQFRSGQGQRNFVAGFVIGGAANDLALDSAAIIHFADTQSI